MTRAGVGERVRWWKKYAQAATSRENLGVVLANAAPLSVSSE